MRGGLVVGCLLLAAGSCSSPKTSVGGGGTPGPIPIGGFLSAFNAAACAFEVRCNLFSSVALCEAYSNSNTDVVAFGSLEADIAAAMAGKAQYSASQAAACIGSVESLSCAGLASSEPDVCLAVFSGGTVTDGGTCITDIECVQGTACEAGQTTACSGACDPLSATNCRSNSDCAPGQVCDTQNTETCITNVPPGALGEPCGTVQTCQSGLQCESAGSDLICETAPTPMASLPAGATCGDTESQLCEVGLGCVISDDGTTATCMKPAGLGQPCTALHQCGAQFFISGIICDETTHSCVNLPSTGPCIGGLCDPITSFCNEEGACVPLLAVGAPCNPSDGSNECAPAFAGNCELDSEFDGGTEDAGMLLTGTCVSASEISCAP